jgi:hypothetical protein
VPSLFTKTLTIRQGAAFAYVVEVSNADGTPFDATGYTPYSEIRDLPNGTLLATFAAASVGPLTGGVFRFSLGKTDTAAIPSHGVCDAVLKHDVTTELVHPIARARVVLEKKITA